jgi:hypothetical protein
MSRKARTAVFAAVPLVGLAAALSFAKWLRETPSLVPDETRVAVTALVEELRAIVHAVRQEDPSLVPVSPDAHRVLQELVSFGPDAVPVLREHIATTEAYRHVCYSSALSRSDHGLLSKNDPGVIRDS